MGYTHYWYRKLELAAPAFDRVLADFRCALPFLAERGVVLAGPSGSGLPVLSLDEVAFNGVRVCGHARRLLGVAWPAGGAGGVCLAYAQDAGGDADVCGQWFAGRLVRSRTCGGDCSHESFFFPRVAEVVSWQEPDAFGRWFCFCKTAFKQYDLAVQVFLVIAAHHLGPGLRVSSDGSVELWREAMELCQEQFGYGRRFVLT